MRRPVVLLLLPLALFAAGCSTHSYCLAKQNYDGAKSIRPIQGSENLRIPDSPTALRIPAPPATEVPYGISLVDPAHKRRTRAQCLDEPPPLQIAPLPPEAPKKG